MLSQTRVCARSCALVRKSINLEVGMIIASASGSQSRCSSPASYSVRRKTDAEEHRLRKAQHLPRKVNQGRGFLLKSVDELTYLTEECSVKYDCAHHRAEKGNRRKRGSIMVEKSEIGTVQLPWKSDQTQAATVFFLLLFLLLLLLFLKKDTSKGTKDQHFN